MPRLLPPLVPQKCEKVKSFHTESCRFFLFFMFFSFFMLNVAKLLYVTLVLYFKETNVFDIKPI